MNKPSNTRSNTEHKYNHNTNHGPDYTLTQSGAALDKYCTLHERVSRETLWANLLKYKALLAKWNLKVNLISRKMSDAQIDAHFAEAIEVGRLIRPDAVVVDFGSGNGIPGILLAILGLRCILVEKNKKKAVFLKEVCRQLDLDSLVLDCDIRECYEVIRSEGANTIVSKAVGPAPMIVKLCAPLVTKETRFYLLKKAHMANELIELEKMCSFMCIVVENPAFNGNLVWEISEVNLCDY